MNLFTFIGLEFHNNRMWKWASVEKALDFMEEFGMNALIFHQNDIIDQVVLPEKYFTGFAAGPENCSCDPGRRNNGVLFSERYKCESDLQPLL